MTMPALSLYTHLAPKWLLLFTVPLNLTKVTKTICLLSSLLIIVCFSCYKVVSIEYSNLSNFPSRMRLWLLVKEWCFVWKILHPSSNTRLFGPTVTHHLQRRQSQNKNRVSNIWFYSFIYLTCNIFPLRFCVCVCLSITWVEVDVTEIPTFSLFENIFRNANQILNF